MIPWEHLDTAQIPGTDDELQLSLRDGEYTIGIVGGGMLMSSRAHDSEDALAEQTCRRLADRQQARVLIGGLGMGFTLAAALKSLGENAEVVVAELVPAVVQWNREPLAALAGNPLKDKRTVVREGDVANVIRTGKNKFDAIMLDVDNGPAGMTRKKNNWLYSFDGLTASYSALKPEGVLAVWSAGPDRNFRERLRKVGFKVSQARVRAHDKKGDLHVIWFGQRE
jgi:spermidine synthase